MSLQQGTTAQTRPHFGPPPVGPRPPICWVIPLLPGADSVQSRIHAFFLRVTLRTSQKGLQKQVLKAEWSSLFREAYRFSLDGRGLTRALSTLRTSELQFALRSLRCSGPPRSWIRGLPCTPGSRDGAESRVAPAPPFPSRAADSTVLQDRALLLGPWLPWLPALVVCATIARIPSTTQRVIAAPVNLSFLCMSSMWSHSYRYCMRLQCTVPCLFRLRVRCVIRLRGRTRSRLHRAPHCVVAWLSQRWRSGSCSWH